jgi:hypothetical protein
VIENRAIFERAGQDVMAKINENEKATEALKQTGLCYADVIDRGLGPWS